MSNVHTNTIAIVGGGFCGTMVAVHLLHQKKVSLNIILVNSGAPLSKGVAFSSYSQKHLLNVKAKSMSAFANQPAHFINWLLKHENYRVLDPIDLPEMFLPRNIYGHYLKDVFENAIRNKSDQVSISFIHDEAIDMEIDKGKVSINFSTSPSVIADKVLIATGNETPDHPHVENQSFLMSKLYFANPWHHESVNHPDRDKEVLIVGNGLTMVDVVIGLREKNHKAKVYSLSPNGFRILPHRKFEPYSKLVEELHPPYDLLKVVRLFRKHVKWLRSNGIAGEAAVDSIRPLTQKIWQSLSIKEKERFMYHIRHMWGVARHRLPMNVHKQIQQMILDDTLEIIAGRIIDMVEKDGMVKVKFKRRRDQSIQELTVGRVINCTGPNPDITKIRNPLMQNLLLREIIEPDLLHLGINALPDGSVITKNNQPSKYIYVIGSLLKGVLWESTAVPELKEQAWNTANKFIEQLESKEANLLKES